VQPPSASPRPPAWPVLVAYAVAFVLTLGSSALLAFAVGVTRAGGLTSRVVDEATSFALSLPGLMASALVSALVLFAVALVTSALLRKPPAAALRLGRTRASGLGVLAAATGMVGLSFACGAASDLLGVREGSVMRVIARALVSPRPATFVIAIVALGLAPGVAEETFFRGLLQTRLAARWGRWPAIAATSVAFGLFHVDPVQGAVAFAAGLFLGWTVEHFGGVRPSIIAHGVNNAIFVALASLDPTETISRAADIAALAIGAATCAGSIALLRARAATRP
jgi:uncharacterized protein